MDQLDKMRQGINSFIDSVNSNNQALRDAIKQIRQHLNEITELHISA